MQEHRELWWPSPTVELAEVVSLEEGLPFRTVHGGELTEIQVSYESWGELSPERDNAVLVIHPMTTDCHVAGDFCGQPQGWWEPLIGPGRALDTERYYVVCPNLLGGCYGTTGPRFPDPSAEGGRAFLGKFPLLTPLDMMRVQRLFARALGIERFAIVIGPSMGGMIAWEWAIEGSEMVDQVVVVAAPLKTTAFQIGLNWLQRRGIELDISGDEVVARWGQMVARGIGMLSYRAPIGMEEKFGRDWFKKPGSRLEERGMFNVESWLRHHGKRITKRFDPYTWILYSRAMDLHDVAQERDGLLAALDRIGCRVQIVGISSDHLYTRDEVRLGANILERLGKPVDYAEIRSPHGHDGFLLETVQLEEILREAQTGRASVVPVAPRPDLRLVRLGLLGGGRVAASFLKVLEERRESLAERHGLRFEIAEVCDIDRDKPFDSVVRRQSLGHDPEALVRRRDMDVLVELTRGSDASGLVERALRAGRHVLTPNKALIHDHGDRLERLAVENGVRLAYHSSIAAGWPLLYAVERQLGQGTVQTVKAIVSSTCNVVLEGMEGGLTQEQALEQAEVRGLTEENPDLDLSGWDTAQKLSLLIAQAAGRLFPVGYLSCRGLDGICEEIVRAAPAAGYHVKLVGLFAWEGERPSVGIAPMAVVEGGHLGSVRGDDNAVVLAGEEIGELVHLGQGSGALPVATALISDLVGLFEPRLSWTGRFPRAQERPLEPQFVHHLVMRDGRAEVTDEPTDCGVPILRSLVHAR